MKTTATATLLAALILAASPAIAYELAKTTPVTSPVPSVQPVACTTTQLHASSGFASGAVGSVFVRVDLANTSSHTCTLHGFPELTLLDAQGASLSVPVVHSDTLASQLESYATRQRAVTLAPRSKASFVLAYGQVPTATVCLNATTLEVSWPPGARTTSMHLHAMLCEVPVEVSYFYTHS